MQNSPVNPRKEIIIIQLIFGVACSVVDLVCLSSSSFPLKYWLGPGTSAGFFLIFAGTLGCLRFKYSFNKDGETIIFLQVCSIISIIVAIISVIWDLDRISNLSPSQRELYYGLLVLTVFRAILLVLLICSGIVTCILIWQYQKKGCCGRDSSGRSRDSQDAPLTNSVDSSRNNDQSSISTIESNCDTYNRNSPMVSNV